MILGKPDDERSFVHKRLFGAAKGLLGGGPLGAIGGFLSPTSAYRPGGAALQRLPQPIAVPRGVPWQQLTSAQLDVLAGPNWRKLSEAALDILTGTTTPRRGIAPGGNGGACTPPNFYVGDICVAPGTPAGEPGQAVMGQYGAALEPLFFTINQRRCLPGMILGKDKLCYNVGAISNKERLWPKGAAPLLTGGEMSAIRKAATAAGKFQRAGKRLAAVGKTFAGPSTRRAQPRRLTAGKTVKVLESGPGSVQL